MKLKNIPVRDMSWMIVSLVALLTVVFAIGTVHDKTNASDTEEIDELIDNFQEAYSSKDASELRSLFYADAVIAYDGSEGDRQRIISLDEWILDTQEFVFDENDRISDVLSNREITVFRNIGYAVCDYNYRSDTKTASGVDVLTFCKKRGTWKIVSLQWTGDEIIR